MGSFRRTIATLDRTALFIDGLGLGNKSTKGNLTITIHMRKSSITLIRLFLQGPHPRRVLLCAALRPRGGMKFRLTVGLLKTETYADKENACDSPDRCDELSNYAKWELGTYEVSWRLCSAKELALISADWPGEPRMHPVTSLAYEASYTATEAAENGSRSACIRFPCSFCRN
jgi:hypothetical protein